VTRRRAIGVAELAELEVLVAEGPKLIAVSGGVVSGMKVSMLHVRTAGVASVLPAWSVALTENVCNPSESPVSAFGEEQAANAPVSSLHSKLEPASLEENSKLAELEVLVAEGPELIAVSGGVVSGGVPPPKAASIVSPQLRVCRLMLRPELVPS
jgi:hypothetical protein